MNIIMNICEYLPSMEIKIRNNEYSGDLEVVIVKHNALITILPTNTWEEIKDCIDIKMNKKNTDVCSICYKSTKKRRVSCGKCLNYWCVECYMQNCKSYTGYQKCPYCVSLQSASSL